MTYEWRLFPGFRLTLLILYQMHPVLVAGREGFYNIAHMVNTVSAVDWAVGRGANGVEIDLQFNSSTGDLLRIQHNPPCDCTCKCPPPNWYKCGLDSDHVCATLYNDVREDSPCNAGTPVRKMFTHLAAKPEVAFIYIDSKVAGSVMENATMRIAGRNVVRAVDKYLFGYNYGGVAVIGAQKFDAVRYIQAAVKEVANSRYKDRIYFTVENERNKIVKVLETLHTLSTRNIIYGTGLSPCVNGTPVKNTTLELATINKVKGVTGLSYIWTVDNTAVMNHHLSYIQGIITNYPGNLYDLLKVAGIKLANQSSSIPATTSSDVITTTAGYTCECDYRCGGCAISSSAPRGMACKCEQSNGQTCQGQVVQCYDTFDHYCKIPDLSVHSCLQGGGNCNGYQNATCNCIQRKRGCAIKRAPPAYTACKCVSRNGSNCQGEITRCKDIKSPYCKAPDESIHTCVLGGGNCNGYEKAQCGCNFDQDGCYISQVAPTNTACKCVITGVSKCSGEVVSCLDTKSRQCTFPDKTVFSCFQGNGNCNGYQADSCECVYRKWGCIITKAPQPNATCHCNYNGHDSCNAGIASCREPSSCFCKHPDLTRQTCILGGGNCGGYR